MRHLIIPNSFFPAVGGVQTSLLNFIRLLPSDSKPIVLLGWRGFRYAFNRKKVFWPVLFPYVIVRCFKYSLILYLNILIRLFSIRYLWLYGGGTIAAYILAKREHLPKNLTIILRSSGSDVQREKSLNYGLDEGDFLNLKLSYRKADKIWALSEEISKIYTTTFELDPKKIFVAPNALPMVRSFNGELTGAVGVVGRSHPKKQFPLAEEVAKYLPHRSFKFLTPGYRSNLQNIQHVERILPRDLLQWPPKELCKFYEGIDVLLVTSAVESFGNINLEAGAFGCTVLINEYITGADICHSFGIPVITYKNYDAREIANILEDILSSGVVKNEKILENKVIEQMITEFTKICV